MQNEEGHITMNEFRTVVESFRSDMKKIVEVMNHRFDTVDHRFDTLTQEIKTVKTHVGLMHEDLTEIKADLKAKVPYDEFNRLEKRVARLERKSA